MYLKTKNKWGYKLGALCRELTFVNLQQKI